MIQKFGNLDDELLKLTHQWNTDFSFHIYEWIVDVGIPFSMAVNRFFWGDNCVLCFNSGINIRHCS